MGKQGGNADAHRDRPLSPLLTEQLPFDHGTNFLGNEQRGGQTDIRQDHDKFLTPEAGSQISAAEIFFQQRAYGFEDIIAKAVTTGIVDLLEMIQIKEEAADIGPGA